MPIASAHVMSGSTAMENATTALMPRPAASASGNRATTPMRIVRTPATRAVVAAIVLLLASSAPVPSVPPRMLGLRTMM